MEYFGAETAGYQTYGISFEGASVSGPIASLSWLEDAGWTLRVLLRSQDVMAIALGLCPFSADVDGEPARQVRSKKIPVFLDEVVGQNGVIEHVIASVGSFLDEHGYQRVLLKSDNGPSATALTHDISRRRQAANGLVTIIEHISLGNSQVIRVVEHGNCELGCQCRALRSCIDDRLGVVLIWLRATLFRS